jgi:hypothetical protein
MLERVSPHRLLGHLLQLLQPDAPAAVDVDDFIAMLDEQALATAQVRWRLPT